MGIDFTGRQMEVTPDLRQYTEERLRKLSRLLAEIEFDVHVILTAEKHRRMAEITLKFRDQTLVGFEETTDAPRAPSTGRSASWSGRRSACWQRRRDAQAAAQAHLRRAAERSPHASASITKSSRVL